MKREYFCGGCGLFHWVEQYKTIDEEGRIERVPYSGCPNEECVSHKESDIPAFAVDTFAWGYFAESHQEFIDKIKWSSSRFAPEDAIKIYQIQGIPIK